MDDLDYWRLCDELNVIQAALLIIPVNPTDIQENVLDNKPQDRPRGLNATYTALINAINSGRLTPIRERAPGESPLIKVDDLKEWLLSRGVNTGFFFPQATDIPGYLDPSCQRCSETTLNLAV